MPWREGAVAETRRVVGITVDLLARQVGAARNAQHRDAGAVDRLPRGIPGVVRERFPVDFARGGPWEVGDQAVALGEELASMGADWQLHCYGNVRHAFTNPAADASTGVTVYNAAADRRSWAAARYFLSEIFDT